MPNLFAHQLVAKRFFLREEPAHTDSFLAGNQDFLMLGALGPDPLFFYGILPQRGLHLGLAGKKFGNRIHKDDGKKYFRLLCERCYVFNDLRNQSRFETFVLGQFAHYLLDREAHPYILYESGFDEEGRIKGKYHYAHSHFESEIDAALASRNRTNYFRAHPGESVCTTPEFLAVLDDNFVPVLAQYFGLKRLPAHLYSDAVKNYRDLLTSSNRHPDFQRKVLGKSRLAGMVLPKEPDLSVLNESRRPWKDPVTGEVRRESFLDLHMRAYDLLDACYLELLESGFSYPVFSKYINGLNFYGTPVGAHWSYCRKEEE